MCITFSLFFVTNIFSFTDTIMQFSSHSLVFLINLQNYFCATPGYLQFNAAFLLIDLRYAIPNTVNYSWGHWSSSPFCIFSFPPPQVVLILWWSGVRIETDLSADIQLHTQQAVKHWVLTSVNYDPHYIFPPTLTPVHHSINTTMWL